MLLHPMVVSPLESRMISPDDPQKTTVSSSRISEEMYRAFIEQASEGIFVADDNFILLDVNAMGCRMTGYGREELIGESAIMLIDPLDFAARPAEIDKFVSGEKITSQRRILRKDGTMFESELSATRVAPGLIIGIMHDISDAKRKEELLRQSNEELERRVAERTSELASAYRELEDFSYSVGHDLRSPIRAMDGFASILLLEHSYELSEEAKSHLQRISANARRMGLLIDTLLAYARMGRCPMKPARLDLANIAHEEWADFAPNLGDRRVEFLVGDIPAMQGDPTLVRLVLNNLLGNALKFTKRMGGVRIEVGYDPETSAVFVKDNGVGFDQRYVGRLFRVFERLHNDDFEGAGVGLATVKRIVEKHGGSVWAEGVVNEGATFRFTLGSG
jgi:PAS domain S-box-containing protein